MCLPSVRVCRERSAIDENALKVLLTHTPEFRRQYYGERALSELQTLAQVKLHEADEVLNAERLVEAARDIDIIVSDRMTEGKGEIFRELSNLRAFVRCAVDIRNVDVAAASGAGVLVTHASPGFVQAVAELAVGFMIDLSRGISRVTADYHAGRKPEVRMGRQLAESCIGIIGYGSIGRSLANLAKVLGMRVMVADPYKTISDPYIRHLPLHELLGGADYVVCLAIASEETENLIGAQAFAQMQPHAFFINLSRGNLVDEAALAAALTHRRCSDGCRPRARSDADTGAGKAAQCHRYSAHWWADAAGDRAPGYGNGAAGCHDHRGQSSGRRRERGALAPSPMKAELRRSVLDADHRGLQHLVGRSATRRNGVRQAGC